MVATRVGRVADSTPLLTDIPLAGSAIDRDALRRADPDLLPRLLADGATRVLVVVNGSVEVDDRGSGDRAAPRLRLRGPEPEDADGLAIYLGRDGEGTAYVAVAGRPTDEGEPRDWRTVRQLGAALPDHEGSLLATAVAMTNWHAAHTHCPRCGTSTLPAQSGWTRRCPADQSEHFPRTDPAVIMAVVDADDRLLMASGAGWHVPGGPKRFSVLAGFVEPGETFEAAVAREVFEEVGVPVTDITYVGGQPWPFPSSIMIGFTARALATELRLLDGEIAEAVWVTRSDYADHLADGSWTAGPRLSISRRLVETWFGSDLPAPA